MLQRIRGDEANLRVLLKDLEEDPEISCSVTFEFRTVDATEPGDALRYGPVAEIIVSLATGVGSGAALDGIKAAIRRARHRGVIEETVEEHSEDGDDVGASAS